MRFAFAFALAACLSVPFLGAAPALSEPFVSPDIVVLGDSQIPFGAGPEYVAFFETMSRQCAATPKQRAALSRLEEGRLAVIGVRSSSLQTWTARTKPGKSAICDVDKKWGVNAGTFGAINTSGNPYVQIGRGAAYQFCTPGASPLEAMFRPGYYAPKLLVMSFLGNAAQRWAMSREDALADVRATMAQLPEGLACVFITSAPPFTAKRVALRQKAQDNLKWAFAEAGASCSFVEGFTPETIAAYQGNARYFRVNADGRVTDPFHPNPRGARAFFELQRAPLCEAIIEQLEGKGPSVSR